jgi:hypothetical protein
LSVDCRRGAAADGGVCCLCDRRVRVYIYLVDHTAFFLTAAISIFYSENLFIAVIPLEKIQLKFFRS